MLLIQLLSCQGLLQVAEIAAEELRERRGAAILFNKREELGRFHREAKALSPGTTQREQQCQKLSLAALLDHDALLLVQFRQLLRVRHVAVGAIRSTCAMPRDEVDAGTVAGFWMTQTAQANGLQLLCPGRTWRGIILRWVQTTLWKNLS